jgi:heme A synthase
MKGLSRYAWGVVLLNVGVILLGAFVRATGSGAGCGRSWPTCQGELLPELEGATAIEFAHRVTSGLALVAVIVLAVVVWRATSKGAPARTGAVLSVAAILGEALIGALLVLAEWVADDTSLARAVAVPLHLVNTLFLLASLTLTAYWVSGGGGLDWRASPQVRRWVILGAVALVTIAATGAVTALADTLFPKDGVGLEVSGEAHFLTRLRILHPVLAVGAASIAWWLSGGGGGARSTATRMLPVLIGAMIVSGSLNILLGVPVWMQLVHLALADALWIVYVLISARALDTREVGALTT